MLNRRSAALVLVASWASLAACRSTTSPALTQTPGASTTATAIEVKPVEVTPHTLRADGLKSLLAYVSLGWVDARGWDVIGPNVYFFDVTRMRSDLNIPTDVSGDDAFSAKLDLILGVKDQGFFRVPLNVKDPDTFAEWGWDIADLDQVLYFNDDGTTILRGDFSRPEIKDRLIDQGYQSRPFNDFTVYTKDGAEQSFAQKPDLLILSPTATILESLIEREARSRPALDRDPAVGALLEYFDGAWGVMLAPRGMNIAYSAWLYNIEQSYPTSDEPIRSWLAEWRNRQPQIGWDMMAVRWRPSPPDHELMFLYHYPSAADAGDDVTLAEAAMREAPTFALARTWSNLITLKSVEARDQVLVVTATTESDTLIGNLQADRNWGLLPVRRVPASQAVDAEWGLAATDVSVLGSGWLLYSQEAEGFAVALPPDWVPFDLSTEALTERLDTLRQQDPGAATSLEEQARGFIDAGIKFYALARSENASSDQVAIITVIKNLTGGQPLESVARSLLSEYRTSAGTVGPVEHKRLQLPAGPAERFQIHQKLTGSQTGSADIALNQYLFVEAGYLYMITLNVRYENLADYSQVFDEIAENFRFIK